MAQCLNASARHRGRCADRQRLNHLRNERRVGAVAWKHLSDGCFEPANQIHRPSAAPDRSRAVLLLGLGSDLDSCMALVTTADAVPAVQNQI